MTECWQLAGQADESAREPARNDMRRNYYILSPQQLLIVPIVQHLPGGTHTGIGGLEVEVSITPLTPQLRVQRW